MIASIAAWLVGQGIRKDLAKPLIYGVLGLLAVAALFIAKAAYDRHVISTNDAQVTAKAEKANRKADAKAADQRLDDEKRRHAENQTLSTILDKGASDATHDPASVRDAQRAFYRCLRQQRAAREAGRPPAACGP